MFIITSVFSKIIGVPEPSIRLFVTILLGYPIGYIYHQRHAASSRQDRNQYILLTGLVVSFFFNSINIVHSFVTIVTSYFLCYLCDQFNNRKVGYRFSASDGYDINWTTAQCVLCLRLMGFSMDYMDGEKIQSEKEEKFVLTGPHSFASDSPLKQLPDFLEFLAYCYFPSAFLIGPQFSFSLYSRFLSFHCKTNVEGARRVHIIRCVMIGVLYIVVLQTLGAMYPTSYLLIQEYLEKPFTQRLIMFWISGKLVFAKYLGAWLLTEGACTFFGINYQEQEGRFNFSGLANCKPLEFELMSSIDHFVSTFQHKPLDKTVCFQKAAIYGKQARIPNWCVLIPCYMAWHTFQLF